MISDYNLAPIPLSLARTTSRKYTLIDSQLSIMLFYDMGEIKENSVSAFYATGRQKVESMHPGRVGCAFDHSSAFVVYTPIVLSSPPVHSYQVNEYTVPVA